MDITRKNRILLWIIIIGLAINIAAISTFLYKAYNFRNHCEMQYRKRNPQEFIRKELNLNAEQEKKFNDIRNLTKEKVKTMFLNVGEKRKLLFNELTSANPDTVKIAQIILQLENAQSLLLHHTVNHYLQLKSVLKEEQYPKLNLLFMDIFGCDRKFMNKNNEDSSCDMKGGGHRHRHGMRNTNEF